MNADERQAHAAWFLAHKRRWPLALMVGIGACLAFLSFQTAWARLRAESRMVENKAAMLASAPQPIPDEENAASVWFQAFDAFVKWSGKPDDDPLGINSFDWRNRTTYAANSPVRILLAANSSTFDLGDKAARMPACNWNLDYSLGFDTPRSYLGRLRNFCKLNKLRIIMAAQDNDWPLVERSLNTAFSASKAVAGDPNLLTVLYQVVCDGIALQGLQQALQTTDAAPSSEELKRLKVILRERLADGKALKRNLLAEALVSTYELDRLGFGEPQALELTFEGESPFNFHPAAINLYAPIYEIDRATHEEILGYLESEADLIEQPNYEFRDEGNYLHDSLYPIACASSKFKPIVTRFFKSYLGCRAKYRLSIAVLAAFEFAKSHGNKWPSAITDLDLTSQEMTDPLDLKHGLLRMREEKDGTLLLWSVGETQSNHSGSESDKTFRLYTPQP